MDNKRGSEEEAIVGIRLVRKTARGIREDG